MKTALEMIEVMQHHINGGEVEIENYPNIWIDSTRPRWDWSNCDYRIKVDPYAELKAASLDPTKQMRVLEYEGEYSPWIDCGGKWRWTFDCPVESYEIRDKPKPTKQIKLLAWFSGVSLCWRVDEQDNTWLGWDRVPSEDKVIEVEE